VLFLDGELLEASGTLVGAVAMPADLVIATADEVHVFDAQGEYLDRLREESLPGVPIEAIGIGEPASVLLRQGGRTFSLEADFLGFVEVPVQADKEGTWSRASEDPGRKKELQGTLAKQAGFTWSRVVTDLHSGSLFGTVGRLFVDLTGIAVIGLTLLGIRLLFKRS
jgi:hypothetical protein